MRNLLISVFLLFFSCQLTAQCNAELIKDMTTNHTFSDKIEAMYRVGANVVYVKEDPQYGIELFSTDGTLNQAGQLLVDLNPGPGSTSYSEIFDFNGNIIFGAFNGNSNNIYALNGANGNIEILLSNIVAINLSQLTFATMGSSLFFLTDNGLYISDGTQAGTSQLKSFNITDEGSLVEFNGELYFVANDGTGVELFISDGTASGTQLEYEFNPGSGSSYIKELTVVNNRLFMNAQFSLWTTNGSSMTEILDLSNNPYDNPQQLAECGDILYFSADTSVEGREPYRSDGTVSGTYQIDDINIGSGDSGPRDFTKLNNYIFYSANTSFGDRQLYIYDENLQQNTVVPIDLARNNADPKNFIKDTGRIYFTADDDVNGREIWRSNGTIAGTNLVNDLTPGEESTSFSDAPFLNAFGGVIFVCGLQDIGWELWITEGPPSNNQITNHIPNFTASSYITNLEEMNGKLYFTAEINDTDGIWTSDMDGNNLQLLAEGSAGSIELIKHNGFIYYNGYTDSNSSSLTSLRSISSSSPIPHLILTVEDGDGDSKIANLTPLKDGLLFYAKNDSGEGIYYTEGNVNNTNYLKDLELNNPPAILNDIAYFNGEENGDSELWKSDGTAAGTQLVANLNTSSDSDPDNFIASDNFIFFTADDGIIGNELYRYNPSSNNVRQVFDNPGTEIGGSFEGISLGDKLIYYPDIDGDEELWISDGTTAGTTMVNINPTAGSQPEYFYEYNSKVYFTAVDGSFEESALWRTDGSVAGTELFHEIASGDDDAYISSYLELEGDLYFVAVESDNDAGSSQVVIWKSDGTYPGTEEVHVNNDEEWNEEYVFKLIGYDIYFINGDNLVGQELWRLPKSCCGQNITLLEDPLPDGLYEAQNRIDAFSDIINQGDADLKAGNIIEFKNGFEVKEGGSLKAEIGPCN